MPKQNNNQTTSSEQPTLFDIREPWEQEWTGMPEFVQPELEPWKTLIVHFDYEEDYEAFAKLIDQDITKNTRSIRFPEHEQANAIGTRYISSEKIQEKK